VLFRSLNVLSASKNLLAVRRFCCDNLVSIEFDPQNVVVKDLKSRKVLLKGDSEGDLYRLPLRRNLRK